MPINAHPDFLAAEKEYHLAQTLEEKLKSLNKMISTAPKHKGAENLRQQLTSRRKKLESQISKSKKSGKSTKSGIKKQDMQAVILGLTNTGKSSLMNLLTNAQPKISEIRFTTQQPVIGMMPYANCQIQLIENPSIGSEFYNKGLTNSADVLLILITNLNQLKDIFPLVEKSQVKKIIVYNNINNENPRKIKATLQSKKHNFVIVNLKNQENIEELKNKIFQSFDNIRVYTKEPGKTKSPKPIILKPGATVKDVAEKILKGFSTKVKETKIWGPSSKFPNQKVGLKHKLKDLDVVEFRTR